MPVRPLTDQEAQQLNPSQQTEQAPPSQGDEPSGGQSNAQVRPLGAGEEVVTEPGAIQQVWEGLGEHARQVNMGIMENVGLAKTVAGGGSTERPEDMSESAARMTGNAAGFTAAVLAPFARSAGSAISAIPRSGLGPALQRFGSETARSATTRPGAFFGIEFGSAAGAGALGGATSQVTDSPTARFIGELAGGVSGGAAAPQLGRAARGALNLSPVYNTIKSARSTFASPDKPTSTARTRAAGRLRRAEPELETQVQRAGETDVLEDAPLSFGELSESPGLLSLEKSVADSAEQLGQQRKERFAELNRVIRDSMAETGQPQEGPVDVQTTRDYLDTLLNERIRVARSAVDQELDDLGKGLNSPTANTLARRELDNAMKSAIEQERQLYEAVDTDIAAPVDSTLERYSRVLNDAMQDRVAANKINDRLPDDVKNMLGRLDPETKRLRPGQFAREAPSAREIGSLRSDILEEIRRERAKDVPDRRKIGILDNLQEGILDDLSSVEGLSEGLEIARNFSRDLNNRFRQGETGRILGFERTGEGTVADTLTLEATLGRSGARGSEAARDLMRAVERSGDPEAMSQIMQDFLTDEFLKVSKTNGSFNPAKARNYVERTRRDMLQNFPELRRRFNRAVSTGDSQVAAEAMLKPAQSPAGAVLRAAPGREMERITGSGNPRQSMREVVGLLGEDETGRALPGMRRAAMDWLATGATEGGTSVSADDMPFLSGAQLRRRLDSPNIRQALEELFTEEQMGRIERIANTARKMDIGRRAETSPEGVISDKEAMITNFARRLGSLRVGSEIAQRTNIQNTLAVPTMVSQVTDRMRQRGIDPARHLVIEAVTSENDDLMRALMTETPPTKRRQELINKQLNAWAVHAASQYGMELGDKAIDTPADFEQDWQLEEPTGEAAERPERSDSPVSWLRQ